MANEKLIYAGPLESQFENLARSWRGTFSGPAYANALERLRNAPKVDAVLVVRCKDCYFARLNTSSCLLHCTACNGFARVVNEDDYCSYGERRQKKAKAAD